MSGHLYFPDNFDKQKQYPVIVVSHPGGGVKEQASGLYAEKLSEKGFIALAFDASHQGESGGFPRLLESPTARVEDISVSIDYLTTLPFIDNNKIFALGICAGAGYSVTAATVDKRIKAVAAVSLVNIGVLFREGLDHMVPTEVQLSMLEDASQTRTKDTNSKTDSYLNYVPYTNDDINEDTPIYAREASEYYRTPRAMYPTAPDFLLKRSMQQIFQYDTMHLVDTLLTQPLIIIAGSEADTKFMGDEIFSKVLLQSFSDKTILV